MRHRPMHWQHSEYVVRWHTATTYELPGMYDTKNCYVQEGWNVTKSGHQ